MSINLKDGDHLWQAYTKLSSERKVIDSTWEDVYYFVNPRKRGIVSTITPGQHVPTDVYDATATQSNITLAAGLSAFLTNAAQEWFELRIRKTNGTDEADEANEWLEQVANIAHDYLRESNFYQQIHEVYMDFGPSGMGILYEEEDEIDEIRFFSRHPKEIYIMENSRGRVDTVFRCFEMTSWQAYQFFDKSKLPDEIIKCVEEQKDYVKLFKFIHVVSPRGERNVTKKDSTNKPFASVWMSEVGKKILKEGGFDEFPFFVSRFYKNSQEPYGYGPGHAIYPDMRMLNDMSRVYMESAEVAVFPPSLVESDGMIGTIDFRAKALNYQKQELRKGPAIQPLLNGANFQVGIDFIDRIEAKIEKAFFVDLFLALRQTKRMTATEVLEVSQERMFMLGPVLGRLQNELLTPAISRTVNILQRRNKLPPPPESLQDQDYDVVYVSPLARAQRAMQARDMQAFLLAIQQIITVSPDARHVVDLDEAIRELHQMHSISPKVINDPETVQEIRAAEQERIAQQQQMLALQQGSEALRNAGAATKDLTAASEGSTGT